WKRCRLHRTSRKEPAHRRIPWNCSPECFRLNSRKCSVCTAIFFHRPRTAQRKEMKTMDNEWMNNPAMKNIDPAKLELIRMAAERTSGKSGRDLAPIMLALITNANKQGIRFSPDEVSL